MKATLIALVIIFGSSAFADGRKPAQAAPSYPGFGQTGPTTPTPPAAGSSSPNPFGLPSGPTTGTGTTAFITDEVVGTSAPVYINTVYCLFGTSSNYSISIQGNDGRIVRVSAGGGITYEIYKGQKFLGACQNINIYGR